MKFMLLIWVDESIEVTSENTDPTAWVEDLERRGIRLQGGPFTSMHKSIKLCRRDGKLAVEEVQVTHSGEFLAGYDILECKNLDEAIEAASMHPVATFGAIEVRQLLD